MKKIILIVLTALTCYNGFAQGILDKIKDVKIKKLPSVDNILLGKEPLSTNLDDAVTEAPEMDNFEPKIVLPGNQLPRSVDGSFLVVPGVWEFHLNSYCMKAGTYGPTKSNGMGHLYAPLKGPRAEIIQTLLKSEYKHPDIKQRQIQVLIWAIIARKDLKDMPKENMITAARLLSPKQLLQLSEGVARKFSQKEFSKLIGNLPAPVQQVLEAENKMRDMLGDANTKYEDLEKVAVLSGIMPEDGGRQVKKGRWSKTPDGFFIRYYAHSYQRMTIQLYVPEDAYTSYYPITFKSPGSKCAFTNFTFASTKYKIKEFDPSAHPGVPSGRGQRIGSSTKKSDDPDERDDALDRANRVLGGADNAQNVFGMATDPLGTVTDKVNPLSPGNMFSHILDFITGNGRTISNSLNGDPPDANYKEYAKPSRYDFVKLAKLYPKNSELSTVSFEFVKSYLEAHAIMVALVKSNDKLGGALQANDEMWSNNQGRAILYYKKELGSALTTTCKKWEDFLTTLKSKAPSIPLKTDRFIQYQNNLKVNGFSKQELEAMHFLNLDDTEIEAVKNYKLAIDPNTVRGDYIQQSYIVLNAWKEYANVYGAFPNIAAPWE